MSKGADPEREGVGGAPPFLSIDEVGCAEKGEREPKADPKWAL